MLYLVTNMETGATHIMEDFSSNTKCKVKFNSDKHEKEQWNLDTEEITCKHCKAIYNRELDVFCHDM